jgi:hypothetical protein
MLLRQYLTDHSIPVPDFAASIDVTVQAVHRYIAGNRVPRREVMDRITQATQGNVTPNDFYAAGERAA